MLRALPGLVAATGTVSTREIAGRLHVSPAIVTPMLDALVRLGCLQTLVEGCPAPCTRCPLRAVCAGRTRPRIWTLTATGRRQLQRGRWRDGRAASRSRHG